MFKRDVSPSSLGSQFPVPAAPVIFECVFFVVGFFVFFVFLGGGWHVRDRFFFFFPHGISFSSRSEQSLHKAGAA